MTILSTWHMRKVMVSEHKRQENGKWKLEEKGEALFHAFGVDYEEFENGVAIKGAL